MTYLELINKVLIRMREDEVTGYDDTAYSKLMGEFVNQIKREVEDSWHWTSLRSSISINTVASTSSYTLTGVTNRTKITHVINNTEDVVMRIVPHNYLYNQQDLGTTQEAAPIYYIYDGETSNEPNIKVWPVPEQVYSLKFYGHFPQADLASNSTELVVPDLPVILGAYALALSERGEDGGASFDESMVLYNRALSDFIAMDSARVPHETDWMVD
jgi:hypothetical protein